MAELGQVTTDELQALAELFRESRKMNDEGLMSLAAASARRGRDGAIGVTSFEMELQRRLKDAVEDLTAQTVASRLSSERLTGQLDASIASLAAETVKARESSERVGRRLIWLTVVLVLLTAALVALPFVQAATSSR